MDNNGPFGIDPEEFDRVVRETGEGLRDAFEKVGQFFNNSMAGGSTTDIDHPVALVAGQRVKVAISWDSNSNPGGGTDVMNDDIDAFDARRKNIIDIEARERAIDESRAALGVPADFGTRAVAPAEKTVGKNGAHSLALYQKVITVNLIGTFNSKHDAEKAMKEMKQCNKG